MAGEGHPHEAVAVPGVRLSPGDALVEIELATVCGSDVHTVSGHRNAQTPLVLGHEQVGRVVALGRGGAKSVDGHRVSLGERVVWSVAVPCGRCARCRRGLPQKCLTLQKYGHERMRRGWELSGGFATHAHILDGTPIVAVPEDIPSTVLAPASCATATVAAALEAASAITSLEGALLLVAGAGMLGLTAAAMATEAGARVVVSEPDPARRETALAFGAVAVSDPRAANDSPLGLAAALVRGGGRGAAPTIALELSGATAAVRTLLAAVDVGGVLVLVGSVSPAPSCPSTLSSWCVGCSPFAAFTTTRRGTWSRRCAFSRRPGPSTPSVPRSARASRSRRSMQRSRQPRPARIPESHSFPDSDAPHLPLAVVFSA
ncbi:alcohol dehydrogenase catalytic domain-containing protein [Leifsonia poae]|uniref:alcohol dehydrogenase catalytic domain-containing protein n=1 Tax=Leifsonia poae TaxID=110933 RepID=UPI003D663FB1